MRILRIAILTLIACLLTGCLTQILVSASKEVMWRLLTPMIGLDPNQTNLLEQPLIKDRMTAFLGPQYEPVISLLKTADELQKEGPLFYVVSRYTPVPEYAEKAGFVWNSETNQMAVMLVTGGSPTIIAEKLIEKQVNAKVAEFVPQWPGELQSILDADALKKQATEAAGAAAANALIPQVQPADIDFAMEEEMRSQEASGVTDMANPGATSSETISPGVDGSTAPQAP